VENPSGISPLLLLGDHAGRRIPVALGDLGLSAADLGRHIACDIGVDGVGRDLARRLDATFIHQRYSRLVIDCNRALDDESSIAVRSDGTDVPGNSGLSAEHRARRAREIYRPYHSRIAEEIDRRASGARRTIVVSVHSFTPVFGGHRRPWKYGVLHGGDSAFSSTVLAILSARWGRDVGENEPYALCATDFTVPHHAQARGLDYLELEIRQDMIGDRRGQLDVAQHLAGVLTAASKQLGQGW